MTSTNSPDESSHDFWKELMNLFNDLQAMVEAGLVVEVLVPGEPSRYALSDFGERLAGWAAMDEPQAGDPAEPHHEFPLHWPEPCPACGATDGFDGGNRCRRCRVAWPPEM
jgi:hypothetical protein